MQMIYNGIMFMMIWCAMEEAQLNWVNEIEDILTFYDTLQKFQSHNNNKNELDNLIVLFKNNTVQITEYWKCMIKQSSYVLLKLDNGNIVLISIDHEDNWKILYNSPQPKEYGIINNDKDLQTIIQNPNESYHRFDSFFIFHKNELIKQNFNKITQLIQEKQQLTTQIKQTNQEKEEAIQINKKQVERITELTQINQVQEVRITQLTQVKEQEQETAKYIKRDFGIIFVILLIVSIILICIYL